MGKIRQYQSMKFFCGIMYPRQNASSYLEEIQDELQELFGPVDDLSEVFLYNHSHYYASEMGEDLIKQFCSFKVLVDPEDFPERKILTNKCEEKWMVAGKRRVNIDPGALTLHNLMLLTTKNYTHRLPLTKGIYGELTLMFQGKSYSGLPWTYPDYLVQKNLDWFHKVRLQFKDQCESIALF